LSKAARRNARIAFGGIWDAGTPSMGKSGAKMISARAGIVANPSRAMVPKTVVIFLIKVETGRLQSGKINFAQPGAWSKV